MSLLQYTSKEMFSSTELIRKSKKVFDKLSNKEIEKAIILRDGKPSFLLLDFDMYESLIEEYIQLKQNANETAKQKKIQVKKEIVEEKDITQVDDEELANIDEINDEELAEALAKIDELNISTPKEKNKDKDEHLKEFWE